MKIIKIRFCNINSLKDSHEIDFSIAPLSAAGLFAITGVTGSGKTTILDVITLALYNRIPRIKSISTNVIKKNGVILTRNMPDGFAEVVYECASGTYRSKWSISKARTGALREYEMEIANATTGILLDDVGRSQVPAKNEALIGLSYDQFVRAILLAQGDFATFLKSDENERGKLLEQITGGEIYRELGKKAYEMNSIHGAELKTMKERKLAYEERLLNEDDYKNLVKQLKQAEDDILARNKEKEKLGIAVQMKKDIGAAEEKIRSLLIEKEKLELNLNMFNQNQGKLLDKHRSLVPVQDKLVQWKQETRDEEDTGVKIEKLKISISEVKRKIEEIKSQAAILTKDSGEDILAAIALLEQKVQKLDREIAVEAAKLGEKTSAIMQLANALQLDFDSTRISEFSRVLDLKISDNQKQIKNIEKELGKDILKDPKKSLDEYRASLSVVSNILREQELIGQLQNNLTENETAVTMVKELLKNLPAGIDIKGKEVENLKLQLSLNRKELENRTLRSSLEEHRKNLEPGKPCPLCGALEHPYFKEEIIEPDGLLKKIEEIDTKFNNENAALISMQGQLEGSIVREKELLLQKSRITEQINAQTTKRDALRETLPEAYQKQDVRETHNILEAHIPIIEIYRELATDKNSLDEISNHLSLANEIDSVLNNIKIERNSLYNGIDLTEKINGIREEWTKGKSNLKNAEALLRETAEEQIRLKNKIESLTKDILPFINRLGYNRISEVLPDLLSAERAEELTNEKGLIDKQLNDTRTESRVVGESLEGLRKKDSGKTLEELEESVTENNIKLQQIGGERDNWLTGKRQHDANLIEIEKLDKVIEDLGKKNRKWDLLNNYIGDAEGKRFSTFAQTLTLYQLIILANRRLAMLDDRYILDIPQEGEDKSLSVIDQHMGDVRRSVKSLSGGETFLISLALALALSDLAARKVELKSLFIDEGFGSLDKLTLDQTIDTLEKLQYESGKNIGVISHVEAMQERITTQIMVSKNGQGYSKIQIV